MISGGRRRQQKQKEGEKREKEEMDNVGHLSATLSPKQETAVSNEARGGPAFGRCRAKRREKKGEGGGNVYIACTKSEDERARRCKGGGEVFRSPVIYGRKRRKGRGDGSRFRFSNSVPGKRGDNYQLRLEKRRMGGSGRRPALMVGRAGRKSKKGLLATFLKKGKGGKKRGGCDILRRWGGKEGESRRCGLINGWKRIRTGCL